MPQNPEWCDARRAQWILEHSWVPRDVVYIFERVDQCVYKRPVPAQGKQLPPWLSTERVPVDPGHPQSKPNPGWWCGHNNNIFWAHRGAESTEHTDKYFLDTGDTHD